MPESSVTVRESERERERERRYMKAYAALPPPRFRIVDASSFLIKIPRFALSRSQQQTREYITKLGRIPWGVAFM